MLLGVRGSFAGEQMLQISRGIPFICRLDPPGYSWIYVNFFFEMVSLQTIQPSLVSQFLLWKETLKLKNNKPSLIWAYGPLSTWAGVPAIVMQTLSYSYANEALNASKVVFLPVHTLWSSAGNVRRMHCIITRLQIVHLPTPHLLN